MKPVARKVMSLSIPYNSFEKLKEILKKEDKSFTAWVTEKMEEDIKAVEGV